MTQRKPKKVNFTALIREYSGTRNKEGEIRADLIVKKLLRLAEAGEQWAIKEVLDRMEGKAVQRAQIDHTTEGQALGASISFVPVQSIASPKNEALPESSQDELENEK